MKSQIAQIAHFGCLLLLLGAGVGCSAGGPGGAAVPDATIVHDCAPWDGPAFTVSIPWHSGEVVRISIWQAPRLEGASRFSFPDATGRVGSASYQTPAGDYEMLAGTVSFEAVSEEEPVRGEFRLKSRSGETFAGSFVATWANQRALCG
jgi:hypothetical protein